MLFEDINKKSMLELKILIADLKAELFTLRFKNKTGQNEQSHKISVIRKDIAKVFTAMRQKELVEKQNTKKVSK